MQHLMKMNFPCLPTTQTMALSLSTRKERDSDKGKLQGSYPHQPDRATVTQDWQSAREVCR